MKSSSVFRLVVGLVQHCSMTLVWSVFSKTQITASSTKTPPLTVGSATRCACKGINTLDMIACRGVSMYACMNAQMYACAHIHINASNTACLHLWNYGVHSHRYTHAQNNTMCTCLHLSNYECVCVHACIRIYAYTDASIYIATCSSMYVCLYTCTHGYM